MNNIPNVVITVIALQALANLNVASFAASTSEEHQVIRKGEMTAERGASPEQHINQTDIQAIITQGSSELDDWHYDAATAKFDQAIKASDEILHAKPTDLVALKNKAQALSEQGLLNHRMCHYDLALTCFRASIDAWESALKLPDPDLETKTGRIISTSRLVDLETTLGRYESAESHLASVKNDIQTCLNDSAASPSLQVAAARALLKCGWTHLVVGKYKQCETEYNQALQLLDRAKQALREDKTVNGYRQEILLSIAQFHISLCQLEKARILANQVMRNCFSTRQSSKCKSYTLLQCADALFDIAYLQAKTGQSGASIHSYDQAVQACDTALAATPINVSALELEASVLNGKSGRLFAAAEYERAKIAAGLAMDTCERGLKIAPDSIKLLRNKGLALDLNGRLATKDGLAAEARNFFERSIDTFNQALSIAVGEVHLLMNKSSALQGLGLLEAISKEREESQQAYKLSVSTSDQAIAQTPANLEVMYNLAVALQSFAGSENREIKAELLNRSLETYNAILKIAPEFVPAIKGKGNVLRDIARSPNLPTSKKESLLKEAIACFDEAIQFWPADTFVYGYKGKAQFSLGALQAATDAKESKASYKGAIVSFKKALKLDSGNKAYCEDSLKNAELILQGKRPTRIPKEVLELLKKRLREPGSHQQDEKPLPPGVPGPQASIEKNIADGETDLRHALWSGYN